MPPWRLLVLLPLLATAAGAAEGAAGFVEGELPAASKREGPLVYAVYAPRAYDRTKPAPLLIALHGGRGTAAHLAKFFAPFAETHGAVIACPQGFQEIVGADGFWWEVNAAEVAALERFIEHVKKSYAIDESRIILFGLADGGELAARFALGKDRKLHALILLNILWNFEGSVRAPSGLKVVLFASRDAEVKSARLGDEAAKARTAIAKAKIPVVARVVPGASKSFFHGWEDEFAKAMEWFAGKRDWPKELVVAPPPPATPPATPPPSPPPSQPPSE